MRARKPKAEGDPADPALPAMPHCGEGGMSLNRGAGMGVGHGRQWQSGRARRNAFWYFNEQVRRAYGQEKLKQNSLSSVPSFCFQGPPALTFLL